GLGRGGSGEGPIDGTGRMVVRIRPISRPAATGNARTRRIPTTASTTTMRALLERRLKSEPPCFTHGMTGPSTRVTAGASRGRTLKTPRGRATRPTTAMVREALFNIIGDSIRGAHVLDLFAGAGTLGIEALSRGAASASFVERDGACANIVAE